MGLRRALVWGGLLGVMQAGDVWTTALARARGAVEAMPVTAGVLDAGGLWSLALLKGLIVVAALTALTLTFLLSRRGRTGLVLYRYALNGCRVGAVAVALVSLHNAVLLGSL